MIQELKMFKFYLQADTLKVLWSFGHHDPIQDGSSFSGKHGVNRGVKSLHLLGPLFKKPISRNDVRQWDVTVNNVC